jgi:hypothetical protein
MEMCHFSLLVLVERQYDGVGGLNSIISMAVSDNILNTVYQGMKQILKISIPSYVPSQRFPYHTTLNPHYI